MRSPGFRRMMLRAGPEAAESLRQQVLTEQARTLAEVGQHRATLPPEPERADGYPPPRACGRRRR